MTDSPNIVASPAKPTNKGRVIGVMSDNPPSVPPIDKGFVKYGEYYDNIRTILQSRKFYPTMVTGLSGNGKTKTIEQVCAELGRPLCRVNITVETDEDDLFGGLRLINGETVFNYGPVAQAMHDGAVLLLDELDLASDKIMCMQPILEGNPGFIKRIGERIMPKDGFTIIATANTKGQGNETGKFVGTRVMNEAFLDRFPFMVEHDYPTAEIEKQILEVRMTNNGLAVNNFPECLVKWAAQNRIDYKNGNTEDVITTRRLIQIIDAYTIFNARKDARIFAVMKCLCRFNVEAQSVLLKGYKAIDTKALTDDEQKKIEDMKKISSRLVDWNPVST